MIDLPDGLHEISREDYDQLADRVNFSTLKFLEKSPAHYLYNLEHQAEVRRLAAFGKLDDDDTDARQSGRVVSMAVFEPQVFRDRCVVYPGPVRVGKAWDLFLDRNPDKEHLTVKGHAFALKIAGAVRASPQAAPMLHGGRGELTVLWTHRREAIASVPGYEIRMKARLDYLTATHAYDLKRTKDASPTGFPREVANYLAHVQAAIYLDGVKAVTGQDRAYRLIAVEPVPPFVVQTYDLPDRAIELGRRTYGGWLDRLNVCREENSWPGYADAPLELELPRWILPDDDDVF